jgi:2-phosphosulfolactate phosphatase
MFVDLILTHQQIKTDAVRGKICIVIDTLRATSTIITALSRGCLEIIPVSSVQEALELKKQKYKNYLLGGEIEGQYLENFHLGNSPLEYCHEILKNKGLILTTTNGTKTLQKVKSAGIILICALLNTKTVGEWLSGQKTDIVICCSGTRGNYSLEDFLTAGRLVTDLKERENIFSFSDLACTAAYFYDYARKIKRQENAIADLLKTTANGQRLLKAGLKADIDYCSQEDIFPLLPFYKNGSIKTDKIPNVLDSTPYPSHI